jgi:hypothetical protein
VILQKQSTPGLTWLATGGLCTVMPAVIPGCNADVLAVAAVDRTTGRNPADRNRSGAVPYSTSILQPRPDCPVCCSVIPRPAHHRNVSARREFPSGLRLQPPQQGTTSGSITRMLKPPATVVPGDACISTAIITSAGRNNLTEGGRHSEKITLSRPNSFALVVVSLSWPGVICRFAVPPEVLAPPAPAASCTRDRPQCAQDHETVAQRG